MDYFWAPMRLSPQQKNILKFALKLTVSVVGLWVVIGKIDYDQSKEILAQSNPFWMGMAFLTFNISQWVSTYRLNAFLLSEGVDIPYWDNLRLYYQGMFYNLFLPGGIGGDGYKVFALNSSFKTPVKRLIRALLFDRGSGLVFLVILAVGMSVFSSLNEQFSWIYPAAAAGIALTFLAFWILIRYFVKVYYPLFWAISARAATVQCLQVIGAMFLFLALGVQDNIIDYLVLFQVSSIAIILPITIGGVGARELVFFYGPQFLNVDSNVGVIFSILFFLVIAVSSLAGMFVQYHPRSESLGQES